LDVPVVIVTSEADTSAFGNIKLFDTS